LPWAQTSTSTVDRGAGRSHHARIELTLRPVHRFLETKEFTRDWCRRPLRPLPLGIFPARSTFALTQPPTMVPCALVSPPAWEHAHDGCSPLGHCGRHGRGGRIQTAFEFYSPNRVGAHPGSGAVLARAGRARVSSTARPRNHQPRPAGALSPSARPFFAPPRDVRPCATLRPRRPRVVAVRRDHPCTSPGSSASASAAARLRAASACSRAAPAISGRGSRPTETRSCAARSNHQRDVAVGEPAREEFCRQSRDPTSGTSRHALACQAEDHSRRRHLGQPSS